MAIDLTKHLTENLQEVAEMWAKDLAAHTGDLTTKAAPTARSIADIAYETIFVNRAFVARLKGAPAEPMDGFPECPRELRSAEALSAAMTESAHAIVAAIGDPERMIARRDGSQTTAFEVAGFAATHMMYHLGQVNYVQTVEGDPVIHWM